MVGRVSRGVEPVLSFARLSLWICCRLFISILVLCASAGSAICHVQPEGRFCSDCKHNVVQAHDILMGKIDLEGCENEEEFDEVRPGTLH